jgi:hypothetical protein
MPVQNIDAVALKRPKLVGESWIGSMFDLGIRIGGQRVHRARKGGLRIP